MESKIRDMVFYLISFSGAVNRNGCSAAPSFPGSIHTVFPLSLQKISPCSPYRGTRTEKQISAVPPCLPDEPTASVRCQHTVCPVTLAMRRRILGKSCSPRPRRPICCPAFRSALSFAELSVDALYSFTPASQVSIYDIHFIHDLCGFVKHFFPRHGPGANALRQWPVVRGSWVGSSVT